MNKFRPLRLAAVATLALGTLLSIPAKAGDWYVSGELGMPIPHTLTLDPNHITQYNVPIDATRDAALGKWQYRPEQGLMGTVRVGKNLRPDLRLEGEVSYLNIWKGEARGEDISASIPWNPAAGWNDYWRSVGGSIDRTRLMVNLIKDFPEFSDIIVPFVGVGIGWSWYDVNKISIKEKWNAVHVVDGSDDHFTYAFYAGANFRLRDNLFLTTRYTASSRDNLDFPGHETIDYTGKPSSRKARFIGRLEDGFDHALSIGLRYKFGHRETYKN